MVSELDDHLWPGFGSQRLGGLTKKSGALSVVTIDGLIDCLEDLEALLQLTIHVALVFGS